MSIDFTPQDEIRRLNKELSQLKNKDRRERIATAALQGLITKLPVIDWQGQYGEQLESAEKHWEYKVDVVKSALGYADALIAALEESE